MLYEFSRRTKADNVATGPQWLHEIKFDGYQMMLIRDQDRGRLISRGGHNWADRFLKIAREATRQTRYFWPG
jgi:bifunctional non-homologous end joining protein LigD